MSGNAPEDVLQEIISAHHSAFIRAQDKVARLNEEFALLNSKERREAASGQEYEEVLERAQEEVRNLRSVITMHKALLPSPARSIPLEIWSLIFMFCLPDTPFMEWNASFPPLVLGRVCSIWRNSTLLTPYLWSSLSITVIYRGPWWNKLNLFMSRSGNVPLSLELIWYPSKSDLYATRVHSILNELVTSQSTRWRTLRLHVPDEALRIVLDRPLPELETLSVGGHGSSPTLRQAPKLRSISFVSRYTQPISWDMPWAKLTEFNSWSGLTGRQILQIFTRCPLLERCRVRIDGHGPQENYADHLVVMTRLKTLTLVVHKDENPVGFLDGLVLPSLKRMEFSSSTVFHPPSILGSSIFIMPSLHALLERSDCALDTLILTGILPYDIEIQDIIKRIPSLTRLDASYDGRDVVSEESKAVLQRRAG